MTLVSGGGAAGRAPSRGRWPATAVALVALASVTGGCVSHDIADQVDQRLNDGMTASEVTVAREAALRQVRAEDAQVIARATVIAADPSASAGSSPAPCTSGRLLQITLTGWFPHRPYIDAAHTARVTGQDLTVDARTGRLCESRYVTGSVVVSLESVPLFSTLS